jgi:hypothetical protein
MTSDIPGDVNCPQCGWVITCPHTPCVPYPPGCITPRPPRVAYERSGNFLEDLARHAAADPEFYQHVGASIKQRADQIRGARDDDEVFDAVEHFSGDSEMANTVGQFPDPQPTADDTGDAEALRAVCRDVLPQIRKTGMYRSPDVDELDILRAAVDRLKAERAGDACGDGETATTVTISGPTTEPATRAAGGDA